MLSVDFAVYIGAESEELFLGFIAEDNIFCVLKAESLDKESGRALLKKISTNFAYNEIKSLRIFEDSIASAIKESNLPANFSLAIGFKSGDKFYLKTAGEGQIYIQRDKNLALLISNDKSASGLVHDQDFLVFTFNEFVTRVGLDALHENLKTNKPHEIIDKLTPDLKAGNDSGLLTIFAHLHNLEEKQVVTEEAIAPVESKKPNLTLPKIAPFINSLKEKLKNLDKKKRLTLVVVLLVLGIFIWSSLMIYQNKGLTSKGRKIEATRQLIEGQLDQAEDVAFLNTPRAVALINDAKSELEDLKKEVGESNKQVLALQKEIEDRSNKILKSEEKKTEEVFDLTVEDESAKATKLYLQEDKVALLNPASSHNLLQLSVTSSLWVYDFFLFYADLLPSFIY